MKELYKVLLEGREDDAKRLWTIFSVMNVINAGLFAFVTVKTTDYFLQIIAPILGICLCILWFFSARRMQGWVRLWEEKLKSIEESYLIELNICSHFKIFREREKENPIKFSLSTRLIGWLLPIIFGVAWLLILLRQLLWYKTKVIIYIT
jgi:hypothetical protein